MEITAKMTPEEYDAFREYQRNRISFEQKLCANYERLRKKHEELCSVVLGALETSEATLYTEGEAVVTAARVEIKDTDAAAMAIELASDFFA